MFVSDAGIRTLADTSAAAGKEAAQAVETAADKVQDWIDKTFSLGLVNTIIYAAIVAVIAFIIIKILQHFFAKKLSGNARIFYRLIYIAIIVIAALCVLTTITPLNSMGTALLASSGIAAAVLGLAAQQTLGNVFSGISISAAKPFEVGEYIEILNVTPPIAGTVKDIGLRHTTILDATNKDIVIPNGILDKEMLRAFHQAEKSNVCSFLDVGISYDSDTDLAMKLMADIVAGHKDCLDVRSEEEKKNKAPRVLVRIQDLSESSIRLRAFVWTVDTATSFPVLSDLRYAVLKKFHENGIEIPYPYRNVVVKQNENQKKDMT